MACLHDPTRGMFSRWKVQICCYLWWDLRSSRSNCWNLSSNLTLYSRSIHKQTVVIQGLFLVRFHLQGGISYWGAFEPWYLPHYSLKDGFFSRWLHWVHFHSYIDLNIRIHTLPILQFIVNMLIIWDVVGTYEACLWKSVSHIGYFDHREGLFKENDQATFSWHLWLVNYDPLTWMSATIVFGIIVDPLLTVFSQGWSHFCSDPTWKGFRVQLLIVIFVEVHKGSFNDF